MTPTLYVVVPALDEAENIGVVVADLKAMAQSVRGRYDLSVVLIDDGSVDGTADVAASVAGELPLHVIRHATPMGPGCAFASGFAHLVGRIESTDLMLTLEADNTSRLELVNTMLRRLDEGHDVVLASPYMYGGGIVQTTPVRIFLSYIANAVLKEFLSLHGILTVSSFFRIYRGDAVKRLHASYGPPIVERAGFECMVEMLMKMAYLRLTISEVPMVLDTSRRVGKSKMRVMRTGIGYLALFRARSRWRALAAIDERHGPADVPVLEEIDEIDEQHRPAAVHVLDEIDERRQPAAVHAPLRGD